MTVDADADQHSGHIYVVSGATVSVRADIWYSADGRKYQGRAITYEQSARIIKKLLNTLQICSRIGIINQTFGGNRVNCRSN